MADVTIAAYLRKNLLYAFLINAIATFLSVQIINSGIKGSLEGNGAVFLVSMLGVIWSLLLSLSSITIFLNVYQKVRQDKIYAFFSYYILPVIIAMIAWANLGLADLLPTFLSVTIPFFITQTIFYIRFLKVAGKFD